MKTRKHPFSSRVHPDIVKAFQEFERKLYAQVPFISQGDIAGAALLSLMQATGSELRKLLDQARAYDTAALDGKAAAKKAAR